MNRRDFLTLSATGIIGLGASSFPLPLFAKGSGGKSYSMIILGDTHFDADPPSIYHAHYNEPNERLNKIQRGEFARNGEMWKDRCPRLLRRAAGLIDKDTRMVLQMGDLIQGDCGDGEVHKKMLSDVMNRFKQELGGLPFVTVVGNHDIRGTDALEAYRSFMPARMSEELGKSISKTTFAFNVGDDAFIVIDFNNPDDTETDRLLDETKGARHTFVMTHGPVLPPDIMWILICNGFSQYVNNDPDKFRDYLVSHEGKKKLEIRTNLETTTAQKVEMFAALIGENTKGDLDELMTCNFSTTGMVEHMVSQITLMDAVKPYFEFVERMAGCGIPSVTLEGTPDDWKLLRKKTRELGNYGVKEWTDRLDPILKEFVAASEGKPNVEFWWNMAIKGRPLDFHLKSDGCIPLYDGTKFDGWFLEFIPFDSFGKRPEKIAYGHDLPTVMTSVPVTQHIEDDFGNVIQTNHLEVRAGIVGLTQDVETKTLRPEIGWLVKNQ